MTSDWGAADRRSRLNLITLGIFLCVLMLFGGASRADELGQPVVRVFAALLFLASGLQLKMADLQRVRTPLLFLLGGAVIVAAQLIPLTGDIWGSLPGREIYRSALERADIAIGPRPLSLTPDRTLNALLAFLPPLATLMTMALIDRRSQTMLITMLLVAVAISSFIAVLQISSGAPYFYRVASFDSGVGIFANRNHQAVFLASAFPLLACWVAIPLVERRPPGIRTWAAFCATALLFPLLLVTGSRAGLLLGVLSASLSLTIVWGAARARGIGFSSGRLRWLAYGIPVGLIALAITLFVFFSRDAALRRLFASDEVDLRVEIFPTLIRMIGDFMPFGSGFGSFDPVFRTYEPFELLSPKYLNHAHNDLAQALIEGGLPAGFLLFAFLAWLAVRGFKLWRAPLKGRAQLMGRVATAIMALVLLASLVDYPLRTPTFAVLAAILCCWLSWKPGAPAVRARPGG